MSANDKSYDGFTAEERSAMKERAKELKAAARREAKAADLEQEVLAKIATFQESDRVLGEGLHAIIRASAPELTPRLWYGMPAYTKNDKIVCHFQPAEKFNTRYATFQFSDVANLDDGAIWATSFAVPELNAEVETRIAALLKQAVA
ncbi:iron chaperone [Longispora albida]|uniref:iron chaperone n=1 Tax=Longispora albida TaxID=203523 RepID=UPI00036374A0|nr:hypothetical protein [Longispora albida]